MRPIRWLHISDIHLRAKDAWSQDVVLRAMCDEITSRRSAGLLLDFILISGDLAYSGKAEEYGIAAVFIDALCAKADVPKDRVYCIPGNHDIDRERQRLTFQGARHSLQTENQIDQVLAPGEDIATLLMREEQYRKFQAEYFALQHRTPTANGLGYVSRLTIEGVRLAIIGLDSAWAADGGTSDHTHLMVGERQVIDAIQLAVGESQPPHVILGMVHHPFRLLRECDRVPVRNRVEDSCAFLHCGHLHEPDTRPVGQGPNGCLVLAAGATFETRHSQNAFAIITLDLVDAKRSVETLQYHARSGRFQAIAPVSFPMSVKQQSKCELTELAEAIGAYCKAAVRWRHYLAAVLLELKAEVPIPGKDGYAFGSVAVLDGLADCDLKRHTLEFLMFRNVLTVLYGSAALSQVLKQHGDRIARYAETVATLADHDEALRARLDGMEGDARRLIAPKSEGPYTNTIALLKELANDHDWESLRYHASRHVESNDATLGKMARRMLALALGNSDEPTDKAKAIEQYRSFVAEEDADVSDFGNLAVLLWETGTVEDAKKVVLNGLKKHGHSGTGSLRGVGQRLVEATGDKEFRRRLESGT